MEKRGLLDLSAKAIKGVLFLGAVAGLGYLVYRMYVKAKTVESAEAPLRPSIIPVTPFNQQKVRKVKPIKGRTA